MLKSTWSLEYWKTKNIKKYFLKTPHSLFCQHITYIKDWYFCFYFRNYFWKSLKNISHNPHAAAVDSKPQFLQQVLKIWNESNDSQFHCFLMWNFSITDFFLTSLFPHLIPSHVTATTVELPDSDFVKYLFCFRKLKVSFITLKSWVVLYVVSSYHICFDFLIYVLMFL